MTMLVRMEVCFGGGGGSDENVLKLIVLMAAQLY